jgi:Caspase domain
MSEHSLQDRRFALLIAYNKYDSQNFSKLEAPAVDAQRLAELLRDPKIGGYEVSLLIDKPNYEIKIEVEKFFKNRGKNDFSLLYFAGHGHKSMKDGLLYLTTINSDPELLQATTVPSTFINTVVRDSNSKRNILIFDCCFSGDSLQRSLVSNRRIWQLQLQLQQQYHNFTFLFFFLFVVSYCCR